MSFIDFCLVSGGNVVVVIVVVLNVLFSLQTVPSKLNLCSDNGPKVDFVSIMSLRRIGIFSRTRWSPSPADSMYHFVIPSEKP